MKNDNDATASCTLIWKVLNEKTFQLIKFFTTCHCVSMRVCVCVGCVCRDAMKAMQTLKQEPDRGKKKFITTKSFAAIVGRVLLQTAFLYDECMSALVCVCLWAGNKSFLTCKWEWSFAESLDIIMLKMFSFHLSRFLRLMMNLKKVIKTFLLLLSVFWMRSQLALVILYVCTIILTHTHTPLSEN